MRIDTAYLKQQLLFLLNEGRAISIAWNCGGDDRHLNVSVDGKEPDDDQFVIALERQVINLLNLHTNGEPHLTGAGQLSIEDGIIMLNYSSECYEEEWDDEQEKWIIIDKEPLDDRQVLIPL